MTDPKDTHVCRDCGATLAAAVRALPKFRDRDGTVLQWVSLPAVLALLARSEAPAEQAAAPPLDECPHPMADRIAIRKPGGGLRVACVRCGMAEIPVPSESEP